MFAQTQKLTHFLEKCDVKWIVYNNVEGGNSWRKWNKQPLTAQNAAIHPKGVKAAYLAALNEHCVLWAPSSRSDVEFR